MRNAFLFAKNVYNMKCAGNIFPACKHRKEFLIMFIVLGGGLLIIIIAVIVAVVSSVVSAVAADQDVED